MKQWTRTMASHCRIVLSKWTVWAWLLAMIISIWRFLNVLKSTVCHSVMIASLLPLDGVAKTNASISEWERSSSRPQMELVGPVEHCFRLDKWLFRRDFKRFGLWCRVGVCVRVGVTGVHEEKRNSSENHQNQEKYFIENFASKPIYDLPIIKSAFENKQNATKPNEEEWIHMTRAINNKSRLSSA